MNVLVTGGAGFIGSHIVEFHLAQGDQVHVVDDLSTGSERNIKSFISNPNFRFDNANLLTWQNLDAVTAWSDRVYHMAAVVGLFRVLNNPVDVMEVNISATDHLLKSMHKSNWRSRLILASTSEVYGNGLPNAGIHEFAEDDALIIEANTGLRWNYAISKLADEAIALSYAVRDKAAITAIRLFNTIGPRQTGQYGMVVPRFVRQAVKGDPLTVFGDGTQSRCFCDVRDTVVMLDRIAANVQSIGEVVNVGNNDEISILELAQLVKKLANSTSEIRILPYDEAYNFPFADVMHRRPSMKKVFALTGMQHEWTLEKTIRDLIDHIRQDIDSQEI